ncbi:hypothetical protein OG407_47825 [Streptomyces sp. NBC_01515]|uniref:hypothetical protein n=1 Tax=Streptomyces sp. NBC_01515 TaxID=2903890 RepID=UPI00386CE578
MPELPFTGELVTVTEQEKRRILVRDMEHFPYSPASTVGWFVKGRGGAGGRVRWTPGG